MHDALFAELGREIARQLGTPMDEHVESATETLEDDDIVAFALVAIRDGEDGVQSGSHRVIDPDVVAESDREPAEVIDLLHGAMCQVFDEEVRER